MHKQTSKPRLHKQQLFDLHLSHSPKDRQYNALTDPHANYYFVSKVAKERLKDLKLSIKREKKSQQNMQIVKQINQKIKFEFPKLKLPLLQGGTIEEREGKEQKRRMSEQLQPLKAMTQRESDRTNENSTNKLARNEQKKSQNSSKLQKHGQFKLKKSHKKLKHASAGGQEKKKVNHEQFLQFLSKKKEELAFSQTERS